MTDRQNVEKQNETKIYKQIDVWKGILDTELVKDHRWSQFRIGTTETTEKKTHIRNQTKINIVIHTVVVFFLKRINRFGKYIQELTGKPTEEIKYKVGKKQGRMHEPIRCAWRYSIFTLRPIPSHMRPTPSSFRPIRYS